MAYLRDLVQSRWQGLSRGVISGLSAEQSSVALSDGPAKCNCGCSRIGKYRNSFGLAAAPREAAGHGLLDAAREGCGG